MTFPVIETLISPRAAMDEYTVQTCCRMFPSLRIFQLHVSDDFCATLNVLQTEAPNLEEISIPHCKLLTASEDEISGCLFCGYTVQELEKEFADGLELPKSFKKLKRLIIPLVMPSHARLLRMFLHSYEDCQIEWVPMYSHPLPLSTFESAISPAIHLCTHALQQCDLRFKDFKLDYFIETFSQKNNLRC